MKKVLVLVLVAFATSVFATEPTNYKAIYKFNNQKNFDDLVRYLNLDETQTDYMMIVFDLTKRRMNSALKTNDEAKINKVLYFNMGNAKYFLSDNQYKKYLSALNLLVNANDVQLFTQR